MKRSMLAALVVTVALIVPGQAVAQLIQLKTVPVAQGDQFLIFPSDRLGMGGVTIALDDTLYDPFENPAKGARVGRSLVFAAPAYYGISQNAGNAQTLPVGAFFGSSRFFGGGMAALQQLENGDLFFGPIPLAEFRALPPDALSRQKATNKYAFLMIGATLPGEFAVGASAFVAGLNAMDGVEHLYAMSADINQSGDLADLRLGVTKSFGQGRTLEAVALYNHFDMTHDVTYIDWILDSLPIVDSTLNDTLYWNWTWQPEERLEHNEDRTNTWGGQIGYTQPIGVNGWRVGGSITVNRKDHPKIPNYEIVNIPRDPGHSTAFDFGAGIAKVLGKTTFGIDLSYQPATSDTWAEAADTVEKPGGGVILPGGRTVENSFSFSNAMVTIGAQQDIGPGSLQLGLQVRAYDYHLDQWDLVAGTSRRQDEQWMEWTPSWGGRLRLKDIELRYAGRITTGTGRPGVAWTGTIAERALDAGMANDIIVPPSGPLTLQDARVITHQISVVVPIR